MMDVTDRHCRFFLRLIAPRALLYTEMVTTGAVLHGDRARFLDFDPAERPLALQLGGSDPAALAECAAIAEDWGYDEVDLNCGCPSPRVTGGGFGAWLMTEPERVAEAVAAMRARTRLPVTIKCRIGVDGQEGPDFLGCFVETVAAAGCGTFIVHARKALLKGLSPKENRTVPPLRYEVVHGLKRARPDLLVVINGGFREPDRARLQQGLVDGVMVGREAYENPWSLGAFETALIGPGATSSRAAVLEAMIDYADRRLAEGVPLRAMTRHLLGLYNGLPGARRYRRHLGERVGGGGGLEVLTDAARMMADADEMRRAA
jgi:tRNA-dihydrouridine synthase A